MTKEENPDQESNNKAKYPTQKIETEGTETVRRLVGLNSGGLFEVANG